MLILHLLASGDKYGYQLVQLIKEHSNGILIVPEGALYPLLYKLEGNGYVSEEKRLIGKRLQRVYYHIEKTGYKHLEDLISDYDEINSGIRMVLSAEPDSSKEKV